MATVNVDSTFDGVLSDNTTYTMIENISRDSEFTLTSGSTGSGIIWNGCGFTITAIKSGWLGLFPCPVTVSHLGILSSNTAADNAGWLFQGGLGGSATDCYSTGAIGTIGGGIFGSGSAGAATNCYSTGTIGEDGGGMFGSQSTGTATTCYSVGSIGIHGGGMFGSESGGTATNCYSVGSIGAHGGGMFGSESGGTATHCYSIGSIETSGGGMFGSDSTGTTITSGNTTGWQDTAARTYLTGTPATSPGLGLTWDSVGRNTPYTLVSDVTVDNTFNGVLVDDTTYRMIDTITRTTEFTLAPGSTGVGIVWNGCGFTITANKAGWLGLFPCAVTVSRLGILSSNTTADNAGWLFQSQISGSATTCYSTGDIGTGGGGIFGPGSAGTATTCYSTGAIGRTGGGIFGPGSAGTATTCYSTGSIHIYGGGIFGYLSSGTATNCYSTGAIGDGGGGIFGNKSTGTATNCYSTWSIGLRGGGIFGLESAGTAINCYSTGAIGLRGGGIFGSGSGGTAKHCYSTGTIGLRGGGIFGVESTGTTITSGNTTGWNDTAAKSYLTGTPAASPGLGLTWDSSGLDAPYTLATGVRVDASFDGILVDKTTYTMTETIPRTTEFTLAPGSSGVGIVWNGNKFMITATKTEWLGLFPCAVSVWNLGIESSNTTAEGAGWFFQSKISGFATNCYSTGAIGIEGGGIFGDRSTGTARSCYSTGAIGFGGGGICGNRSLGSATTCYSTGTIGTDAGGIFGSYFRGTATNCYSTGAIGLRGGGIFGPGSRGTATNCYSTGSINIYGGGIFGRNTRGTATNCYTTGTIGQFGDAIFGYNSPGTIIDSGNTTGWFDVSATVYLTGTPATRPGLGRTWDSSGPNTPFTLAPFIRVDTSFDGVLADNTIYNMIEDITITTEFTLAPGSSGFGIVWDGNGCTITATKDGWLGLFPCDVNVWNTGIESGDKTANNAGWFFRPGISGSATNCYSTGAIGRNGGGIIGSGSGGTATNCYSTGAIGLYGGGIIGSGSGGTATNCYSTGAIGTHGGGIFGRKSEGTARNCYSTGTIGTQGGAIFGLNSSGKTITSGNTTGWIDVSAATFLTGTPSTLVARTSVADLGVVWDSSYPDTPYTLNMVTACFFDDAPVLTPSGYRRIDSLRVGDKVTTPTGEDVITQIYKRTKMAGPNNYPYSIPAGTFGAVNTLLISPRQCIAVKGAMVEARKCDLKQVTSEGIPTYYNLELKRHSNIIVAGVEVKSYVPR